MTPYTPRGRYYTRRRAAQDKQTQTSPKIQEPPPLPAWMTTPPNSRELTYADPVLWAIAIAVVCCLGGFVLDLCRKL